MRRVIILLTAASLILITAKASFSQEQTGPTSAGTEIKSESAEIVPSPEAKNEAETQWVWGEAASVDAGNKTLVVKYLDYETDQEKELALNVDEKTTYENVKSLAEISPKDTLSIDYIVTAEGKNIAKNISVEKPEAQGTAQPEVTMPEAPAAEAIEATPEDLQKAQPAQ